MGFWDVGNGFQVFRQVLGVFQGEVVLEVDFLLLNFSVFFEEVVVVVVLEFLILFYQWVFRVFQDFIDDVMGGFVMFDNLLMVVGLVLVLVDFQGLGFEEMIF